MASIIKRSGKYQAKVYYYDNDGKRHAKSKAGFKTKREAQLFAAKYELKASENDLGPGSTITLSSYFDQWYKLYKKDSISLRTQNSYDYTSKIIERYFKNVRLIDVTRKTYQQFLQKFGHNHAKETVAKINIHIHSCVRNALYDGIIKKDFIEKTTLIYDKKRTQKIEYLSIEDLTKLVDYVKNSLNYHFTSKYMILLAIYTGARLGEAQGLQWRDINFSFKTIQIRRAWSDVESNFTPTKNEASMRVIRINPSLIAILKQLKLAVNPEPKQRVFINQYGTVPTSNAVNKTLRESLAAADIKKHGFHFHSLRHTHVAFLLANQIDLYAISKRLGHSDIGTTSRVYSYMIDEYRVRTDNEIEQVLQQLDGGKALNGSQDVLKTFSIN